MKKKIKESLSSFFVKTKEKIKVYTNNYKNKQNELSEILAESQRIKSIDRFRGFLVFCMLVFQFLNKFDNLTFLNKLANHYNHGIGIEILPHMTIADMVAPAFIFAIGLTFAMTFIKRQKLYGTKIAVVHHLERSLGIIGLGCFLGLCGNILDSFGGKHTLNAFDYSVLAVSVIMLIGIVLRLLTNVPKLKNNKYFPKIAEQIFYISISVLGIMDIIITCIDWHYVLTTGDLVYRYWLTLQDIGFAMLIALPLIKAGSFVKFTVATAGFIGYTVYHQQPGVMELLDIPVHGGIIGGFGWAMILIYSMIFADLYFKDKTNALIYAGFFAGIGILLTQWIGVLNLGSCSPTFIITNVGLSGLIFMLFDYCDKFRKPSFDFLVWWGKNPIVMFLVEFFAIGLYTSLVPDSILKDAPLWLALLEGIIAVAILTAFAYLLSRKKKTIRL